MRSETVDLLPPKGPSTAHVALPDEANSNGAAILVIQEYWGINDHIRDIASRYAGEGYVCAAPDLYRGKLAHNPREAAAFMKALGIEDGIATIAATLDEVKRRYGVGKIGITGYC